MDFTIRNITISDAEEISVVHHRSWEETYRGLIPDEVLDSRSFEKSHSMWIDILSGLSSEVQHHKVLEITGKIVGLVSYGQGRDEDRKERGEIYSLYLLSAYQGKGIGTKLFLEGIRCLQDLGFNSVYLWVLSNNSSELFYQKMNGRRGGEKDVVLMGHNLKHIEYIWDDL